MVGGGDLQIEHPSDHMEKGDPFPHLKDGLHGCILKTLGARAGHGGPGGGQTSSYVLDKNTLTNKETNQLANKEAPGHDYTLKNAQGGCVQQGPRLVVGASLGR